jgi:RNA polymerase sigma-70 factor (ECF subfamily)
MGKAALAEAPGRRACGERFLQTFAEARAELLQALTRFLGSGHDAQDVLQEAFLKCWRCRDRIAEVRNLRGWIFRVALNTARDLRRNLWRRRWRSLPDLAVLDERPASSPPEQVVHRDALERLRSAVGALRPEEQAVFLLRQNSCLTYDQIATVRRTPVGTVKTQMRAALHKLRATLHEPGPG